MDLNDTVFVNESIHSPKFIFACCHHLLAYISYV